MVILGQLTQKEENSCEQQSYPSRSELGGQRQLVAALGALSTVTDDHLQSLCGQHALLLLHDQWHRVVPIEQTLYQDETSCFTWRGRDMYCMYVCVVDYHNSSLSTWCAYFGHHIFSFCFFERC